MRNPLQDQLLKAGLVKKSQVAQAAREQAKQRQGKAPAGPTDEQREAERVRAERVERDRALAAERNAQARAHEQRAQARHIIETQRVRAAGEIEYRFVDGAAIRAMQVDAAQRTQLASGALVIARHGDGYALLPRAAVDKVRDRDASLIVLDHAQAPAAPVSDDDAHYAQFKVPDDLIW
ncbi:DUF2058 domain-containing protein [Cognatilysobacter bugurensis]|uniref:DUF2058 domain-containing protein n=1 Tax=Cognatilysobacter bugurensis TaxID=543356 RepID=A0A918SYF8_9GAMM|nr:DUF2058 domain-containing protein [Lysobacter bugurensis]GHA79030.1 hypothetical protein GCM10007067_15580 [Lysobacter bugurensis]